MPNVFPTLASGSARVYSDIEGQPLVKYPLTYSRAYLTRVIRFLDDSEQRWTVHDKLHGFVIEYRNANGYDTSVVRNFFFSMKGAYVDAALTNTFSLTIDGAEIEYCVFDQDDFLVTESREMPNTFSFSLRIKQVRRN